MTPEEFKAEYMRLESALAVQEEIQRVAEERIDNLMAAQANLATQHLDELTPLRDGQDIEIGAVDTAGNADWSEAGTPMHILSVMQVDLVEADMPNALRRLRVTVWAPLRGSKPQSWELDTQPGAQWRYPADQTAALAAPQEVRS
jgi:hypothetical protein